MKRKMGRSKKIYKWHEHILHVYTLNAPYHVCSIPNQMHWNKSMGILFFSLLPSITLETTESWKCQQGCIKITTYALIIHFQKCAYTLHLYDRNDNGWNILVRWFANIWSIECQWIIAWLQQSILWDAIQSWAQGLDDMCVCVWVTNKMNQKCWHW